MCNPIVMSMWVTNTGSAYILTPIVLKSFGAERQQKLDDPEEQRSLMGSLLSVAYACNTGGMGTLVGTGSNLVAVRYLRELGVHIDFVQWLVVGVPASLSVVCVCYVVLYMRFKPVNTMTKEVDTRAPKRWSFGEKVVAASFVFTASLWVFPAFYTLAHGSHHDFVQHKLLAGVSVLIGTFPMFIISDRGDSPRSVPVGPPVGGGHRVLPWSVAKNADWGIVMLVGGGLAIGSQMKETGLADVLAETFVKSTGIHDIWVLTFVTTMLTIFVTEITSNTATTSIMDSGIPRC
ncbi:sdcS [Symbiodinium natans]|uniref:SdcS protein n=1 Tax=Symbiodinium natans TaxID=878477 RepID=A0A812J9S2_9DINO|nr:sdcS [Symbiodinium natans]